MNPKYILLISAVISIAFSWVASLLPIGLYDQWTVSGLYPTLFTPATFTFSIWSVIYLSWIALWLHEAFWNSWISKKNVYLLASAQILSSLWLVPSQYLWLWTSLIVMFLVLATLVVWLKESRSENIYFRTTLELFFWWILVACIANIHLVLVAYNIYIIPEILTYISILIALGINIFLILKHNIFIPSLVLIWAGIGIIIWQEDINTQILSGFAILTLLCIWVQQFISQRK